jgi:hypothetical protein
MLARVVLDEIWEAKGESQRETAVKRGDSESGDQPPAPNDLVLRRRFVLWRIDRQVANLVK